MANSTTDLNLSQITDYQLGIIFGLGYYNEKESRLVLRHQEKYYMEQIQPLCGSKIYKQSYIQRNTERETFILKTHMDDVEQLKKIGWINRNNEERGIPELDDYRDFLRAYLELHSRLGYCTSYKGSKKNRVKYYRLCLRIYGNKNIIHKINKILSTTLNVEPKSVQIVHNNKTAFIQYAGYNEICEILNYINGSPCNQEWWEDANSKKSEPTRDTYRTSKHIV